MKYLYILTFWTYLLLLIYGLQLYATPFADRAHQQQYRLLRPAGTVGHAYGVIGSGFMVLMLGYTLRKRLRFMRRWGPVKYWLRIHIYLGIFGPLLIILHTSLKVQGLVAVSFWSMVLVAVSGVFGRYLYIQIPRNIQGDMMGIKELEEANRGYADQIKKVYGLSDEVINKLEEASLAEIRMRSGALSVLAVIVKDDILRLFGAGTVQKVLSGGMQFPREHRKRIMKIIRQKTLLMRRVLLLNQVQQLFHYWHVLHKPFAVVMYAIMVVHVVIALLTGFTWVL